MLKLAGFNSTIYSFNKKTGVSLTPTKGGIAGSFVPKMLASPTKEGSDLCYNFFDGFVHNALRAPKGDHLSQKSNDFPHNIADIIISPGGP